MEDTETKLTFTRPGDEGTIIIRGNPELVREASNVLIKWAIERGVEQEVASGRDRDEVLQDALASVQRQAKEQGLQI